MKRRLLVIFLTLCLILGLFPISASAADSGSLDVTTIYVSNQGGGDGASEKDPTTLESALETINRAESDTEKSPEIYHFYHRGHREDRYDRFLF